MGVLAARGITTDDPGAPAPEPRGPTVEAEPEAPEQQPKPEPIPLPKADAGRKPGSRRDRAAAELDERMEARLKDFETKVGQERLTYEQRIQEQQREMARLQGVLEEMRARPAPQPIVQAPAPVGPEPDDLRRQARKALAESNMEEWERLNNQANEIVADRRADAKLKAYREEFEKKIPPQVDPRLQTLIMSHQHVAMAGPQGLNWVQIKDQELGLRGVAPGPERLQRAFALADKEIEASKKPAPTPAFDQRAASALAGVPTNRPAGGGGNSSTEEMYTPTAQDKVVIDSYFKGNKTEFMKWKYPERWMNKR